MFPLSAWHRYPSREQRPGRQLRKRPLPSGRLQLGLLGLLLQWYSRQGVQAGGSPPTPQDASSGCPLLCTCCTQSHPQSQGDKTSVCNPGRWRLHSSGSSGVLAASEGSWRPGAGRQWCCGKRRLVAKTQKELEDPTDANPRARSSLPSAVRSQDSVEFKRAQTSSFQLRY